MHSQHLQPYFAFISFVSTLVTWTSFDRARDQQPLPLEAHNDHRPLSLRFRVIPSPASPHRTYVMGHRTHDLMPSARGPLDSAALTTHSSPRDVAPASPNEPPSVTTKGETVSHAHLATLSPRPPRWPTEECVRETPPPSQCGHPGLQHVASRSNVAGLDLGPLSS